MCSARANEKRCNCVDCKRSCVDFISFKGGEKIFLILHHNKFLPRKNKKKRQKKKN